MATKQDQRLAWLETYLEQRHPGYRTDPAGLNKQDARSGAMANIPFQLVPDSHTLFASWFTRWFRAATGRKKIGSMEFPGGLAGKLIVAQLALPLENMQRLAIEHIVLARADITAVENNLIRPWFAKNQPAATDADIDLFITGCLSAAGF